MTIPKSSPRQTIKNLEIKDQVETTLLIKSLAVMESRDKKKYLNVIFTDATGDLEARGWNNAENIAIEFQKGDVVSVKGKLNLFQGRKQLVIGEMIKLTTGDYDEADFIASSQFDPEVMYEKLCHCISHLEDYYIRELLLSIVKDQEISRRLKLWQAGKTIHHAYQSGLLEHILSCTELSLWLAPRYNVNTSYVVAGAILHDLCKIYELTDGANVEYTEEGKLVGHLVKGVELLDRYSYRIKDFPHAMRLHLKHILLSHHGEYEYGSPKIPQTSEAMLVHLIDFMDSKMHSFEAIKKTDPNIGHWSNYVKNLDRIIYKGDLPTFREPVLESTHVEHKNEPQITHEKQSIPEVKKNRTQNRELKQNFGDLLNKFKGN